LSVNLTRRRLLKLFGITNHEAQRNHGFHGGRPEKALLWLCREELAIPDDYEIDRDVSVEIDAPFSLNTWAELEATLEWEDNV
jgi:hypothetical protein